MNPPSKETNLGNIAKNILKISAYEAGLTGLFYGALKLPSILLQQPLIIKSVEITNPMVLAAAAVVAIAFVGVLWIDGYLNLKPVSSNK